MRSVRVRGCTSACLDSKEIVLIERASSLHIVSRRLEFIIRYSSRPTADIWESWTEPVRALRRMSGICPVFCWLAFALATYCPLLKLRHSLGQTLARQQGQSPLSHIKALLTAVCRPHLPNNRNVNGSRTQGIRSTNRWRNEHVRARPTPGDALVLVKRDKNNYLGSAVD